MRARPDRSSGLLREVARMHTRAQRVVADCCRTTRTQGRLLTELTRCGAMSLCELGTRVSLQKSGVSRAVEAVIERGLVTREPNPRDARSWLARLTDEDVRTVDDLDQALDAHAGQLPGSLSARERAAVENSLGLLMKALPEDTAAHCCLPPPERRNSRPCG